MQETVLYMRGPFPIGGISESAIRDAVLTAKEAPPARSVFLDLNQQVTERATALIELIQTDPEFATQQTLELLRQASLDEKWIPYIVYATEELRFQCQADQDLVWTRLLGIACEFRNRKEATFEKVVFSALHRVASLMPEDKVANLRPLLDNTGTVDTRLVGLQAIKTVFSVHPAKQICDPLLANRINELAIKFIDRDVLIPGQNSAIAETSILALACLKSDFVIPRLRQAAKLQLSWFSKILRKSLRQMSIQWDHSEATAKKWLDDLTSILE